MTLLPLTPLSESLNESQTIRLMYIHQTCIKIDAANVVVRCKIKPTFWAAVTTGRSSLEAEVTRLVATLTSLTSNADATMRVLSLQCLVSCMDLPYHLLHPLRKQVLAAVLSAVDDDKRRVRQEAVKCRGVWSSGP